MSAYFNLYQMVELAAETYVVDPTLAASVDFPNALITAQLDNAVTHNFTTPSGCFGLIIPHPSGEGNLVLSAPHIAKGGQVTVQDWKGGLRHITTEAEFNAVIEAGCVVDEDPTAESPEEAKAAQPEPRSLLKKTVKVLVTGTVVAGLGVAATAAYHHFKNKVA